MQISAIRYFLEVARSGSIRRAAEKLHIAPSAVSRQLQKLEHDLGARLVERYRSGIRLTDAGQVLYDHAAKVLRDLDTVRDLINDLRHLRRGEVTIWSVEAVQSAVLAPMIAQLQQEFPEIAVSVSIGSTERILDALRGDEANVGIVFNAPRHPDLTEVATYKIPLYAIVSPTHSIAKCPSVKLRDLQNETFSLPDPSFGLRQLIDRAARVSGVALRSTLRTNSFLMCKALAACGRAVTLLPLLSVASECRAGELIAVALRDDVLTNGSMEILVRRNRAGSFAAKYCVSQLKSRMDSLYESGWLGKANLTGRTSPSGLPMGAGRARRTVA